MTLAARSETTGKLLPSDGWEQTRRVLEKKWLSAAPVALHQPVWRLWACHRHLTGLETGLSLAAMFGVWVRDFGLREDDAAAILAGFLSPARMGQFKFASDLVTALAAEADGAIKRRKQQTERAARTHDAPTDPADMAKFREWLGKYEASYPRPEDVL